MSRRYFTNFRAESENYYEAQNGDEISDSDKRRQHSDLSNCNLRFIDSVDEDPNCPNIESFSAKNLLENPNYLNDDAQSNFGTDMTPDFSVRGLTSHMNDRFYLLNQNERFELKDWWTFYPPDSNYEYEMFSRHDTSDQETPADKLKLELFIDHLPSTYESIDNLPIEKIFKDNLLLDSHTEISTLEKYSYSLAINRYNFVAYVQACVNRFYSYLVPMISKILTAGPYKVHTSNQSFPCGIVVCDSAPAIKKAFDIAIKLAYRTKILVVGMTENNVEMMKSLRSGKCHLLITTPHMIQDLIKRRLIALDNMHSLVFDLISDHNFKTKYSLIGPVISPDLMKCFNIVRSALLSSNNAHKIDQNKDSAALSRQILMFVSKFSQEIDKIVRNFMGNSQQCPYFTLSNRDELKSKMNLIDNLPRINIYYLQIGTECDVLKELIGESTFLCQKFMVLCSKASLDKFSGFLDLVKDSEFEESEHSDALAEEYRTDSYKLKKLSESQVNINSSQPAKIFDLESGKSIVLKSYETIMSELSTESSIFASYKSLNLILFELP
ncbi:MAG: ATP-dependent RNA helicase ddx3x, partial [Marteilia pararefringens]